jgi:hypothetical protein
MRTYKSGMLIALTAATFLPAAVAVAAQNWLSSSSPLIWFFSIILLMSSAHVWITGAYYLNRRWMSFFKMRPVIFFVVPMVLIVVTTLSIAYLPKTAAMAVTYAAMALNLWHHSKQNWGILAMVGRIRGVNLIALRPAVIYAWPFVVLPWLATMPDLNAMINWLPSYVVSLSAVAYLVFFLGCAVRGGLTGLRDPWVALFILAVAAYFIPVTLIPGSALLLGFVAAHAMQYYVMVFASLSMRERRVKSTWDIGAASAAAAIIVGLTVTAWIGIRAVTVPDVWESTDVRLVLGFIYGINLIHFWVDAFIWRFSDADVRQQHGDAFVF